MKQSTLIKLKATMPELQDAILEDFIPLAINLSLPQEERFKHFWSVIGSPNKALFRSDEIPLLRYYYKKWEGMGCPVPDN